MTARHSAAVARYSREIAQAAGLSEREQELVHTAALLHDLGKFVWPDSILKGGNKLTDEEFEIVKQHPEVGARIVTEIEGYGPVCEIILAHHERIDGKGYPNGLAGEEIPVLSRIISVADTYDVMTARDSYRQPVSSFEAIQELRRVSGSQLDAHFVEIFVELLRARTWPTATARTPTSTPSCSGRAGSRTTPTRATPSPFSRPPRRSRPRGATFATSSSSELGSPVEPGVQDLPQHGLARGAQGEREHVRVVPLARAPRPSRRRAQRAARTPGTLLAAIDAPVPVQQPTTPCSARPSATSRAAASLAHAQSSRSSSFRAPCSSGSWPRLRSSSTRASATPVRSSAATETLMGAPMIAHSARIARGRDHRAPAVAPRWRLRGRVGAGARAW